MQSTARPTSLRLLSAALTLLAVVAVLIPASAGADGRAVVHALTVPIGAFIVQALLIFLLGSFAGWIANRIARMAGLAPMRGWSFMLIGGFGGLVGGLAGGSSYEWYRHGRETSMTFGPTLASALLAFVAMPIAGGLILTGLVALVVRLIRR